MALTRERKIFVGVFAVALAALAVDRLVLQGAGTGPAPTSGAQGPAVPTGLVGRSAAAPAQTPPAVPVDRQLAERLRSVAERLELAGEPRDVFQASSLWQIEPEPGKGGAPAEVQKDVADAFTKAHKLTAILAGPEGGRLALIDDSFVAVGHEVDGFRVVSIGSSWVIFRSGADDRRIVLRMQDPL